MCGIVGYIGHKKAEPILLEGLKRLEYRGYDSAGLAFLKNNEYQIVRAEGKLENLIDKIRTQPSDATIGIGHTRWATHGRPSETNAHPHNSKDVVLVHNGIIENYLALKQELQKKGFEFKSDTDTEVICHLLQDHLNSDNDFLNAFRAMLKKIHGAFSFVVLHKNTPDKIFIAKKGSPLVAGIKDSEAFVASDIPALLSHTREMYFVEDYEMGVLSPDGIQFSDFDGNPIQKQSKHIPWSAAQAEKGGYKHFMLKEIMEQPRSLADTLLGRIDQDTLRIQLEETEGLLEDFALKPTTKFQIIACGTSWHAGLVGKYWIESLAKIPVQVELSSEFRYRQPLVDQDTIVMPISQSGETADTLAAVKESKRLGAKVLSICNVIESSIPRESDATLYTYAGPEIGVASTKAFTTQMSVLYMLALKLAEIKKTLSQEELSERVQALLELPNLTKAFLRDVKGIDEIVEKVYKQEHCYFLGRGLQYPIVLEGALKLKEISYIHAEGYPGGEMKHGPIALIEEGIPVLATTVRDNLYDKMVSGVEEVAARGADVFLLVSEGEKALEEKYPLSIEIPQIHSDLLPFLTVLPFQLIAYHCADRKGTDVDQPRNLAKSVTVE